MSLSLLEAIVEAIIIIIGIAFVWGLLVFYLSRLHWGVLNAPASKRFLLRFGYGVLTVVTIYLLLHLNLVSNLLNIEPMKPGDWMQMATMTVLILATSLYAIATYQILEATKKQSEATRRQAEASVKMAEAMREQRYDGVRPVIDIQRQKPSEMKGMTRAKEILTTESNLENVGLSCILCNIGLGPAIDAYSFTPSPNEQSIRHNYGVLAVGEKTTPINLLVKQVRGRGFIVVYYKDDYGRNFESKREVVNEDNNRWILDSLISNLVEEV